MAKTDYDQKLNSKSYRFFDIIFRLVVLNVLMVVFSCTIVLMYPALVATVATMKEGPISTNVFKQFFINFKKYFFKSLFIGIIVVLLVVVSGYAIYFYATSQIQGGEANYLKLFLNAGFIVCLLGFIVVIFLSGHLPQLIITFPTFTTGEYLKTALFITFRYILTTLILLVLNLVIIITFLCCMIRFQVLAIWMLFGISLPTYLGVKMTQVMYYKLSKIDFERIMHAVEEEDEE